MTCTTHSVDDPPCRSARFATWLLASRPIGRRALDGSHDGDRYLAAIAGETAAAVSKTQTREGARTGG
jgi:hypothetical protein